VSAAAEDVLVLAKDAEAILVTDHQGIDVMTIADTEDHQIVVIVTMAAEASKDATMAAGEETEGLAAVTVVIEPVITNTQLLVEAEEMIVVIVAEAPLKGVMNTRRDPHLPTEEEMTETQVINKDNPWQKLSLSESHTHQNLFNSLTCIYF
jgi:hypothetical protein